MEKRRPLKSRSNRFIKKFAKFLSTKNIRPNQVSLLSIVFALVGAIALAIWNMPPAKSLKITLLVLAIIGVQGRLLCNLFDGMIAIEGGKTTPDGELYNDVPDRISDTLLLTGLGLGLSLPFALVLGLIASMVALLTAYIRMLGAAMGTPAFFVGPMAKQHRMAALTVTLVMAILCIALDYPAASILLYATLILIILGSLWTCWRRLKKIQDYIIHV